MQIPLLARRGYRWATGRMNGVIGRRARRDGLAPPIARRVFVDAMQVAEGLEIGPFCHPILRGPGARHFDVFDRPGLVARGAALGFDTSAIPPIDYVSAHGDLAVIDADFALVASSHSVEHQPDLIRHLRQVERLLRPGGAYNLIVPDKRYSFDHYLPVSTLDDVLAAHREGRQVHTPEAVRAHRLDTTHNNALAHWLGWHGRKRGGAAAHTATQKEMEQARNGEYVDVHAWTFTPASFRAIVHALHRDGLIGLVPETVHATGFATLEFYAILRRA
jgi:SAM-dependent methyltransferase